ncbi:hypothetical protein C4D60_Mb04t09560 [Musa balbisiana]|uniref:DNA-directed RNA polymerase III subunit n=1 Tax=Musa balbisiana TaxID=52838 RepID=A0A4S8KAV5_MUSBA|nr:hypothetical protein C4D60_Mb04t09560 [Musa balbisiana]
MDSSPEASISVAFNQTERLRALLSFPATLRLTLSLSLAGNPRHRLLYSSLLRASRSATRTTNDQHSPSGGGGATRRLLPMAFRGRGRGRGGRGRGMGAIYDTRIAKHVPYEEFPEDVTLPSVPSVDPLSNEVKALIASKIKLEYFWKGSCYNLQEGGSKSRSQVTEIERFSDRFKQKAQGKREALAHYLKLTPSNFPSELIQGSKRGQDGKVLKEKKGESDDEEDVEEEVEEESSDDDDYNQNIDFDDDEDDLNMEEEEHEDVYE